MKNFILWLKEVAKEEEIVEVKGSWTYGLAYVPTESALKAQEMLRSMGEY